MADEAETIEQTQPEVTGTQEAAQPEQPEQALESEVEIPHFDTTEVIGDGWFPDDPRVLAIWNTDATETPIAINHAGLIGTMKPNVLTLMPEVVAKTLVEDSGYDVEIQFNAIVNAGVDESIEEAVAAVEAKCKAKAKAKPKKTS